MLLVSHSSGISRFQAEMAAVATEIDVILAAVSRQLSEISCQWRQLSEETTVRGDNCQRGQLSEDQLSEETVRTFLALGQL